MDTMKAIEATADAIALSSRALNEDQRILLAGAMAVWLDKAFKEGQQSKPIPDRQQFEREAVLQGGINLVGAQGGSTRNGLFPATYYYDETEIAWRMWSNKK